MLVYQITWSTVDGHEFVTYVKPEEVGLWLEEVSADGMGCQINEVKMITVWKRGE